MLVSIIQQSESAKHIHIVHIFWISLPFRSPQSLQGRNRGTDVEKGVLTLRRKIGDGMNGVCYEIGIELYTYY